MGILFNNIEALRSYKAYRISYPMDRWCTPLEEAALGKTRSCAPIARTLSTRRREPSKRLRFTGIDNAP